MPLPHDFKSISPDLKQVEAYFREVFSRTTDIVFREFYLGDIRCLAIWIDGLTNIRISHDLFRALMLDVDPHSLRGVPPQERIKFINHHLLPFYATIQVEDLIELQRWIMLSKLVLLIDGCPMGLVLDAEATPIRSITEPVLESVVMGPRDAFVESMRVNTALIRSHLGDTRLKSELFIIGRRSTTTVTLMYIEDIANPDVIAEVRKRLAHIDIDAILGSSVIIDLIQDKPYSLFPLMKKTERPDKVVADLLEGRFAIITDNTPMVVTAPSVFVEFMQTAEDYYVNPIISGMIVLLRYMALVISTSFPAIYVAIAAYHAELIPIPLVFSVAGARETVPFPSFVEALLIMIIFELLVEAGIRLPRVVGGAVNIVGALILGQAAVQAGLVSPFLVIIIAATAISNFVLGSGYQLMQAVRVIRFVALVAAQVLGLYGITLVFLWLLIYMAGLSSFGVPYLYPLAPWNTKEIVNAITRPNWLYIDRRPDLIATGDKERNKSAEQEQMTTNSKVGPKTQEQQV